jgi:hypothetical protein
LTESSFTSWYIFSTITITAVGALRLKISRLRRYTNDDQENGRERESATSFSGDFLFFARIRVSEAITVLFGDSNLPMRTGAKRGWRKFAIIMVASSHLTAVDTEYLARNERRSIRSQEEDRPRNLFRTPHAF